MAGDLANAAPAPSDAGLMSATASKKRRRQCVMLAQRDGPLCWLCNEFMPEDDRHVTLVIPRSRGGTRILENSRLAHERCNNERPTEFVVSNHAAQRFREHVRPDLDESAAGDELRRLLYAGREVDRPDYLNACARAEIWMLIAPNVFVPCGARDGRLIAITVMRSTLRTRPRVITQAAA